jgi:hypothetical protein
VSEELCKIVAVAFKTNQYRTFARARRVGAKKPHPKNLNGAVWFGEKWV